MPKRTPEDIRNSLGLNACDYLEKVEKDVFAGIMKIARAGKPSDAVKLKALQGIYNKIRPDKTKLDLDVKSTAPYEVLVRNLGGGDEDGGKGGGDVPPGE